MSDTVKKVDPKEISPMVREINKGLMVRWINADLINRAYCDVRKSFVFYDADMMFAGLAMTNEPNENGLKLIHQSSKIRFYSKGV